MVKKTQGAIFPIDNGHEVKRNCLAPWSASLFEYGLCVTPGIVKQIAIAGS